MIWNSLIEGHLTEPSWKSITEPRTSASTVMQKGTDTLSSPQSLWAAEPSLAILVGSWWAAGQ